jgi:hypothetical protein
MTFSIVLGERGKPYALLLDYEISALNPWTR